MGEAVDRLLALSRVRGHTRTTAKGKVVQVKEHTNSVVAALSKDERVVLAVLAQHGSVLVGDTIKDHKVTRAALDSLTEKGLLTPFQHPDRVEAKYANFGKTKVGTRTVPGYMQWSPTEEGTALLHKVLGKK